MKLISFEHAGQPSWGAVVGDAGQRGAAFAATAGVVDLGRRLPGQRTLRAFLEEQGFKRLLDRMGGGSKPQAERGKTGSIVVP